MQGWAEIAMVGLVILGAAFHLDRRITRLEGKIDANTLIAPLCQRLIDLLEKKLS